MSLLQQMQKKQSVTTTENGAKTYSTSLNACLDMFFMGGASRNKTAQEIINLFNKAYYENSELALKILAYIRDVRGGMGERRFFRICIKHMAETGKPMKLDYIPEIGRWDDLLEFVGTPYQDPALNAIGKGLKDQNALCAKWMPRQGKIANLLRRKAFADFTPKEYRKYLVALTNVVETQMCKKEWLDVNYSHVPSIANVKYNKAFLRNDETRRREFLEKAKKGEVKINSSAAFPDDVVYKTGLRGDWDTAIAMWNQLPNYLEGKSVRMLPVCDVSGSMYGRPIEISVSLGMYISERNDSIFKDAFVTFSTKPKLQYLKGDLRERYLQLSQAEWAMSTDLDAVFQLILSAAIKGGISQDEMPTHILIISDMEFNQCARSNDTAFQSIKRQYKAAGYELPNIIFWNVNSRQDNVPVRFTKEGVGLVSGASPAVLQAVLSGTINPIDIMLRAVDVPKYQAFVA